VRPGPGPRRDGLRRASPDRHPPATPRGGRGPLVDRVRPGWGRVRVAGPARTDRRPNAEAMRGVWTRRLPPPAPPTPGPPDLLAPLRPAPDHAPVQGASGRRNRRCHATLPAPRHTRGARNDRTHAFCRKTQALSVIRAQGCSMRVTVDHERPRRRGNETETTVLPRHRGQQNDSDQHAGDDDQQFEAPPHRSAYTRPANQRR
jgi:hypothetical protein